MLQTGTRRAVVAALLAVGAGTAALAPVADAGPHRAAAQSPLGGLLSGLPLPVPQLDPAAVDQLLRDAAAQDPTGTLPAVVAQLTPEQITELLSGGDAGLAEVLDGLDAVVATLLSGQPSAGQVDQVVRQVTAILGGGLPTDPAQAADLQAILERLPALLETPGLDPSALSALQGTIASLLGVDPSQLPGGGGAGSLSSALAGVLGTQSSAPARPPGTAAPAATPAGSPAPASASPARNTRFRARLSGVRVLRANRAVRVTVSCPTAAPFCVSALTVATRGKRSKPRVVALRAGATRTIRIRLPKSVTRALTRRGGTVKVTALTAGSSLAPAVKRVRARRG